LEQGVPHHGVGGGGLRICGAAERLHRAHAARAQLRHRQVPQFGAVPKVLEDSQKRVCQRPQPAVQQGVCHRGLIFNFVLSL